MHPINQPNVSRFVGAIGLIVFLLPLGLSLMGCTKSNPKPTESQTNDDSKALSSSSALSPAGPKSSSVLRFREVPGAFPNSEHRDGSEQNLFSLVETTGGGCAVLDFDRDGRLDVVTSGGGYPEIDAQRFRGHPGQLFRNKEAFSFVAVGPAACVDMSRTYNSAIIAADYDNDGFTDFLVTGYGALQWFHNQGDGTFESPEPFVDAAWSTSAAFFDADQDGDLDLYIVHYANWSFEHNPFCPSQEDAKRRDYCGPTDFVGLPDTMLENLGNGEFVVRNPEAMANLAMRGLGVIAADLDGDRDTDLYVTNDVEPNLLFRNDGPFQWTELGRRAGVATNDRGRAEGSMGVAIGDYNNDLKFDLWVTNYADEFCALYRGDGPMTFAYATNAARIPATDERAVGWGTAFGDLDLDGDEDVVVLNGHLERYSSYHDQRPQLLENSDGNRFVLAALDSEFFRTPQSGRGLATADFDRDGLIDLVVSRIQAPCGIIRNESEPQGAFLEVRLVGTSSNRDAIGAVATLMIGELASDDTASDTRASGDLKIGNSKWIRQIVGGGSYASTCDPALHFGIPSRIAEQLKAGKKRSVGAPLLRIDWPSGKTTEHAVDALDRQILIIEEDPNGPMSIPPIEINPAK